MSRVVAVVAVVAGTMLASQLGACVPFAVPPLRVRGGAGLPVGRFANGDQAAGSPVFQGEVAVHPLQLVPATQRLPVDAGLGWGMEGGPSTDQAVHGPHLEGSWFPVVHPLGDDAFTRIELRAQAELLLYARDRRDLGAGATLGAGVEIGGFSSGPFASDPDSESVAIGMAHGVAAFGLDVAVAYRTVGEASYFTTLLSLSARLPLLVGVLCCVNPFAGDDDDDVERTPARPSQGGPSRRPPVRLRRRPQRTPARPRRSTDRTPAAPRREADDDRR